tara:strand:- start:15904 stop:16248 length:345 start_codon:yes stop_codon:yes gene_type:complete
MDNVDVLYMRNGMLVSAVRAQVKEIITLKNEVIAFMKGHQDRFSIDELTTFNLFEMHLNMVEIDFLELSQKVERFADEEYMQQTCNVALDGLQQELKAIIPKLRIYKNYVSDDT